jgi:MYXO-CTERM domain-containing protein
MRHAVVFGALVAFGLLSAPRAEACGGFFCSQAPIDQAGERIVFGVNGSSIEAHVQIQYQGEAKKFAWVVPVQAKPTLSVGSAQLFTYLDQMTQPRFQLQWEPSCQPLFPGGGIFSPPVEDAAPGGSGDGGVVVVSREDVGPYDAATLTADDAVALREWLTTNGYDIPEAAGEALTPYVGNGYYFVALKLQQDKDVGDLRPIVLKSESNRPCVPIRLTAIAARPDMPIIAYVLSQKRAIPMNYRHVLINPTRVDWLGGGRNYPMVASAAVDEAGGRAFLTEFAGSATRFAQGFKQNFGRNYDTAALAAIAHPVDFTQAMLNQGFLGDSTVQGLLRKYIPMPASLVSQGVSESQFYNFIWSYRSAIDSDPGRPAFDGQGLAQALETQVVQPLKGAISLLDAHPYLTRLYTTMSAEEMTVDPDFDFNPDAPDISNVFTARARFATCQEDVSKRDVRIELPDGRFFFAKFNQPVSQGPSAERVEQYSDVGAPMVIQDNSPVILGVIQGLGGGTAAQGCGCGATDAGSVALLTLVFGAWSLRRRRN